MSVAVHVRKRVKTCENSNPTSSFCTLQCNPGSFQNLTLFCNCTIFGLFWIIQSFSLLPGCFCPPGLVEFNGECIPEEQGPSVELPTAGPPSHEVHINRIAKKNSLFPTVSRSDGVQ